jgi:hypothetical protein
MVPGKINYKIYQGTTFKQVYRWETSTTYYANIQSITKSGPCVITTTTNHNIPPGWRIRVTNVGGMKEINTTSADQYYVVNDATGNTLIINQVNSSGFTTYTGGGTVEYKASYPLQYYSAVMQIRPTTASDTIILARNSTPGGGIVIDPVTSTITVTITAAQTALFDFTAAVYGIELTDTSGNVTPFLTGNITLVKDVIR